MAVFPLPARPTLSYKTGGRRFGAQRDGRTHAACDLIAAAGTAVRAVEDGTVIRGPYKFLQSGAQTTHPLWTYALEVRHSHFIVRYGEIAHDLADGVVLGGTVAEGQVLATVGAQVGAAMLHFEMYNDPHRLDELTQRQNAQYLHVPAASYQRRSDLLDPTTFLDSWQP